MAGWVLATVLPRSLGKGANLLGLPPVPCQSPDKAQFLPTRLSLPALSSLTAGAAPAARAPSPANLLWHSRCPGVSVQPLGLGRFTVGLGVPSVSCLERDRGDRGSSWVT